MKRRPCSNKRRDSRHLHPKFADPSRNLPEPSGTLPRNVHRNFPEPSGTLRNLVPQRAPSTAELIIGWRSPVLRCSQTNNPDPPIFGFGSCRNAFSVSLRTKKGPKKSAVPRNTTLSHSGSCKECLPCCFHIQTGPPTRARCLKIRPSVAFAPAGNAFPISRQVSKERLLGVSRAKKVPLCCCGYKETIAPPSNPLQAPFKPPFVPPSSPLQAPFTLKPPWSPFEAPLKPPWSPLEAPLKPPWSPLEAPLKPPWRSRPASPLQAPFVPPSSPLQAPFKPLWSPLEAPLKPPWSPLEAPLKPSWSPLEAPLKVSTCKPPSSPLRAPFKPPSSPLQAPLKPPWSPLEAPFKPPFVLSEAFMMVRPLEAPLKPFEAPLKPTLKPPFKPPFKPFEGEGYYQF